MIGWAAALLGGLFGSGRNVVTETVGAFRPNSEASDARAAEFQKAALSQMAAEFAGGAGWFDQLVDGLNRLPRPILAFGCFGLLASAMIDPIWFAARMQGLALVPDPLWALLAAIIAFYFGARELAYVRSGSMRRDAARILASAPQVAENLATLRALRPDSPGAADTGRDAGAAIDVVRPGDNPALEELRRT